MDSPRFGAHMSIAGGPASALLRGHSIGCDTVQMFTRNANQWRSTPLSDAYVEQFATARRATSVAPSAIAIRMVPSSIIRSAGP